MLYLWMIKGANLVIRTKYGGKYLIFINYSISSPKKMLQNHTFYASFENENFLYLVTHYSRTQTTWQYEMLRLWQTKFPRGGMKMSFPGGTETSRFMQPQLFCFLCYFFCEWNQNTMILDCKKLTINYV